MIYPGTQPVRTLAVANGAEKWPRWPFLFCKIKESKKMKTLMETTTKLKKMRGKGRICIGAPFIYPRGTSQLITIRSRRSRKIKSLTWMMKVHQLTLKNIYIRDYFFRLWGLIHNSWSPMCAGLAIIILALSLCRPGQCVCISIPTVYVLYLLIKKKI